MDILKFYLFLLIAGLTLSSCSSDEDDVAPEMLWSVSVESTGNTTTAIDPYSHYQIQMVVDGNSCEATLKCDNYNSLVLKDGVAELKEYKEYTSHYVATAYEPGTVKIVFDKMPEDTKGTFFLSYLLIEGHDGNDTNSIMVEIQRKS